MEPPLLSSTPHVSSMRETLLLLILLQAPLVAQSPAEEEAYVKVREARDAARQLASPASLARFEQEADRFLGAFPGAANCGVVELWRGDLLREERPREALLAYGRSGTPEGRQRAADLAFRHEAPPPLLVDSWIGEAVDLGKPTDDVTLLVFFSVTHPQTARLLPHLVHLQGRWQGRGLRMAGVAAVVDDAKNQSPALIRERLQQRPRPFPVAIDRQRGGLPSDSLRLYRGGLVPWAVVIDRYGRIVWLDGLELQPNALARFERRIDEALAEPTLEQLREQALSGGPGALERLARIRTVGAARALAAVAAAEGCARREDAAQAVRALLPDGSDLASVRWEGLRYDFAADRVVRR